ncbi:MAG: hypothetical protein EOO06_04520 [Chitinophagaceae bacterium]|nr:MAG: hypothetical protein EOO06_04520 [Chitinophagaceae bacterium]
MNQHSDILLELAELSPALAAVPRVNVFKAPEGYFETFPALLLLQTSSTLTSTPPLADVPKGYFEGLASEVLAKISREESGDVDLSPLLLSVRNNNPYQVPVGYFENLAGAIVSKTLNGSQSNVAVETAEISDLVAGIGNKNVYSVPTGYFEQLALPAIASQPAAAKVVKMSSRKSMLKYAAAAVITGLIATAAFFTFTPASKDPVLSAVVMKEAAAIIDNKSFDKELESLNDADIVNFLESKGQDVDAALVASLTEDAKLLPDADDYLINENTLDEVLKNLNLNN